MKTENPENTGQWKICFCICICGLIISIETRIIFLDLLYNHFVAIRALIVLMLEEY